MQKFSYVMLAMLCLWPVSAAANWQYTKWGMSIDQVITASKGAAAQTTAEVSAEHSPSDGSKAASVSAPYSSGTFQFTAYFMFDRKNTLCSVELELTNGDPSSLIGALRTKYGKPISEDNGDVLDSLIWYVGGDMISILKIGNGLTTVGYQPRMTPDNSGL